MNNYKIAILITTFLRDTLLYKTIQTIIDFKPDNCIVLIADQGYSDSEKDITIDYYKSQIPLEYYKIPFDSGLSYGRNFLVQKASEMNIPYCLLLADSIQFIQAYNFQPIIEFLEQENNIGLVGFDLEHSKCPWEYLMEITPSGIKFSHSTIMKDNFLLVDICRNIFLAKTQTLLNLWDNEMKLAEHELAFIEYKKRGYKVYWTNTIKFKKINTHTSDEYVIYRKRFADYRKLMQQKLGITGWVIYPK